MSDHSKLKALAEAATPGPWVKIASGEVATADYEADGEIMCDHIASGFGCGGSDPDDAAFVAAANPAVVLELIAESERLETENNALREALTEKLIDETVLSGITLNTEGLTLGASGGICRIMADAFGQMLYEGEVENYIEAHFSSSKHPEMGQILVTVKKEMGKTPHALRMAAEQERDQLRAEIAGLRTGYEAFEQVNAGLKAECEGLRKDAERATYWKQRAKSAEGHLWASDREQACEALTALKEKSGGGVSVAHAVGMVLGVIEERRRNRLPADRQEVIWCACGDGHVSNSYGSGFMAANGGVCENCDAGQPKVSCPLELFEGLRDSAAEEAAQHRQAMGCYRPHRQELLDAVVRQCDELISGVREEASNG